MIFLTVAKELCDKKCDHIGGTFNQIPSTDEIMPDLNHSGIYNTQNSQQTYTVCVRILYLNHVVPDCQVTNKVNKERYKCKHWSQETKHSSKLFCTVVFLKGSDTNLCKARQN